MASLFSMRFFSMRFLSRVVSAATLVFATVEANATIGTIASIETSSEVLIRESSEGAFQPGDLLLIRSQGQEEVLGYAQVTSRESSSNLVRAQVRSHSSNALIRVSDLVESIDLSDSDRAKHQMQQGRHDLVIRGNKRISSKYKPQVYLGALAGQTAATVENDELFVGPGLVAYGLVESLQISTQPFLNALGETNVQLKWQAFQTEDYWISIGAEPRYNFDHRRAAGSLSFYWDTFSNSKFLTYHQLRIVTGESELYERKTSAEFSVNYGYITNRWNRIIFGPNVDLRDQTLGGLISYQWIWDHFHSAFSVQARDFTRLEFGNEGYLIYLDFWWRI
jgi:hypothetical protein